MAVFKRKIKGQLSKFYYVKFELDGKQILKSTGLEKKKDAEAWEKKYVSELRSQKNLVDLAETIQKIKSRGSDITLDNAMVHYLKIPRSKELSHHSKFMYESYFGDFVNFLKDNYPDCLYLQDVTTGQAEDYMSHMQEHGRWIKNKFKANKVSNRTYNAYLNICKMVFTKLKKKAGILENPFDEIPWKSTDHVGRDVFTKEELKLIGETVPEFLKPLFIVGLYTGLRRGDICTLSWKEVNLEKGMISKKMSKTGNVVDIPILSPLYSYLSKLEKSGEFLFPELKIKHDTKSLQNLSTQVTKYLNSIGIENSSHRKGLSRKASIKDIHSLRHTFIWLAAEAGVPLSVIQSVVGHMTKEMTQHYANHATIKDSRRHLQFLENYLDLKECEPQSPSLYLEDLLGKISGHENLKDEIRDLFKAISQ